VVTARAVARIMVIDDDPALLRFTCKYLSRLGYSAVPFRSAEVAWKSFEASAANYGLVVIDLSMPGIPGEQLARMMLAANPRVRLILTSGYPFDTEKLLETGRKRIAFLHKPFTPAMLAETVEGLLREPAQGDAD
jgi:DNA-binding response OmpR family regulator